MNYYYYYHYYYYHGDACQLVLGVEFDAVQMCYLPLCMVGSRSCTEVHSEMFVKIAVI